jgi:hypothetical protein
VTPAEAQSFTANLNDTGLDVSLAFLGLDLYGYTDGDTFSATFADEGTASFTIIATDGCSIAMDTVSVEVAVLTPTLVGSYSVNDGPAWHAEPATYSCLEACAEVFGGASESYSCSTTSGSIDNLGYYEGYGIGFPFCGNTRGEDDKVGETYVDGSWSAYVSDHGCSEVNYCFM